MSSDYTPGPSTSGSASATVASATTASIPAQVDFVSQTEDIDVTLGFNAGMFTAVVTRTAGASASVAVLWYADAARTISLGPVCGSAFGGATPNGAGKVYGPSVGAGTASYVAGQFRDDDATGKLHLRVYNHSATDEGTFSVSVAAYEAAP